MSKSSQRKIDYNKQYNKDNNYANQKKYQKAHPTKTYGFQVFLDETDIIEFMDGQKNKAGYLKDLVKADMQRQKEHK